MGSPFSTGFKSTIDPFLNLQEHVLALSQVSFDVERATSIRITLTEIENFATAISPGSSSYLVTNLVTKVPLLVPSPYLLACVASEAKKEGLKGEGEGRRGNACPQTPRFWKTPLDISRFGSFVN